MVIVRQSVRGDGVLEFCSFVWMNKHAVKAVALLGMPAHWSLFIKALMAG